MGLFSLIKSEGGILSSPGDHAEARVTDSNRKVLKLSKNNDNDKYSRTEYPNGTVVETTSTKKR